MKVALSHDWLNGMRGGEKCLEKLCELYPESDIFTLFYDESKVSKVISGRTIHTSPVQSFPLLLDYYRYYLPFFPKAIESFDLSGYDLLISTSHCVAKGARKGRHAVHICYCFTPMRYAWELFNDYFAQKNFVSRSAINFFMNRIRRWDFENSRSVDKFIAISEHVKNRIKKYYGREADVIYPPVDTEFYTPDVSVKREDFYLAVSALVPYKKIEVAVKAFSQSGRPLVIVGDGPCRKTLEAMAGPTVKFVGWQSAETIRDYYRRARALVFPGEEDFGIVPVEMQACGGPVLAFKKGGALETVLPGKTGLFFDAQTPESLNEAVEKAQKQIFSADRARENALRFNEQRFKNEIRDMIGKYVDERRIKQ